MEKMELDVLVIGFGKAGKTIAMKRAAAGDRVALVEQSPEMYGGTCINVGCVPTKRLLTEAHSGTDFPAAKQSRNEFIGKLNQANKAMAEGKGVLVIDGFGTFTGPKTVQVGEELELTAETIIINTGATTVWLDLPGIDQPHVYDSTRIQQLEAAPASLAIIGAGPIGLEFATMFNTFGTQVTVYNGAPEFLGMMDRDVAAEVRSHLTSQGIEIVDAQVNDLTTLEQEAILVAIGRRPAIDNLGLEAAGIEFDRRGITVDEHCQTNVPGVYAAGDVNGGPQFTYVSFDDHRVIMSHRWGDGQRTTAGRVIPTTTFLNPPLATVGMTEQAARDHHEVEVRVSKIAEIAVMPRPKILKQPEGLAKFLIDKNTGLILGASLFCVDAQELINTVALAIAHDIPAAAVGEGIYTHPSSSELFNALLV